jgi:hypothetical protein
VKRGRDLRLSSLFEVESYAQKVGWDRAFGHMFAVVPAIYLGIYVFDVHYLQDAY